MSSVEIVLCFDENVDVNIVHQIAYGIEEEGLPYKLIKGCNRYRDNAHKAANESALDVGIGIDCKKVAVRHRCYEASLYLFDTSIEAIKNLKSYGANAARLIKGIPFKKI